MDPDAQDTRDQAMTEPAGARILHASCVALNDRAVLITGASGSGKSGLALALMAYGATLVADDRTVIRPGTGPDGPYVLTGSPAPISGLIEARGIGILPAQTQSDVPLALVVDMDQSEQARLPEPREISYFNCAFRLLHKVESAHFAPAILQYLKADQRSGA